MGHHGDSLSDCAFHKSMLRAQLCKCLRGRRAQPRSGPVTEGAPLAAAHIRWAQLGAGLCPAAVPGALQPPFLEGRARLSVCGSEKGKGPWGTAAGSVTAGAAHA